MNKVIIGLIAAMCITSVVQCMEHIEQGNAPQLIEQRLVVSDTSVPTSPLSAALPDASARSIGRREWSDSPTPPSNAAAGNVQPAVQQTRSCCRVLIEDGCTQRQATVSTCFAAAGGIALLVWGAITVFNQRSS